MGLVFLLAALIVFALAFTTIAGVTFALMYSAKRGSPGSALVVSIFMGGIGGLMLAVLAGMLIANRFFQGF